MCSETEEGAVEFSVMDAAADFARVQYDGVIGGCSLDYAGVHDVADYGRQIVLRPLKQEGHLDGLWRFKGEDSGRI